MKLKGIMESEKSSKWIPKCKVKALFSEFGIYGSREEAVVEFMLSNFARGCLGLMVMLKTENGSQYEITPFSKFAEFSPKLDIVEWIEA